MVIWQILGEASGFEFTIIAFAFGLTKQNLKIVDKERVYAYTQGGVVMMSKLECDLAADIWEDVRKLAGKLEDKKDSVNMLLEEALDSHDFDALRSILGSLGYQIPRSEPNSLEVPQEWDGVFLRDDLDLEVASHDEEVIDTVFEVFRKEENPSNESRTLQLEFAIRKRLTPLIRILLCSYGHNITFKADLPPDKDASFENEPNPLL